MYPFIRMAKELWISRNQPPLELGESHISHHICWPWDLDQFMEMNNGRVLSIYDLGRFGLAQKGGLIRALLKNRWKLAMAGCSVRYRRRIKMMERFETHSRVAGWDDRFERRRSQPRIYMCQSSN